METKRLLKVRSVHVLGKFGDQTFVDRVVVCVSCFSIFMKIISVNARGIGTVGKKKWIKEIVLKENPSVLGIHESKCQEEVNENWIEDIWGHRNVGFVQKGAVGSSGGIILTWDLGHFSVTDSVGGDGFIAAKGKWKNKEEDIVLVNVYGPQADDRKLTLWNKLLDLMNSVPAAWCLFGDFNVVRNREGRLN